MAVGKERICEAYMRVASGKAIDKITVADIIREAGINRSSFYYHFRDAQNVLNYMYDFFADRFRDLLNQYDWKNAVDFDTVMSETYEQVAALNQFIYDNREMFLFLRDRGSKSSFYDKLIEAYMDGFRKYIFYFSLDDGTLYTMPNYENERYLKLSAFQQLAFVDMWADSAFSEPPDYMTKFSLYIARLNWECSDRQRSYPRTFNRGTLSMEQVEELMPRKTGGGSTPSL